ncbi:MAG: hypothetical protein LH702_04290 [Phormidesmis sp. CAN_BIN44]|nr:hypothetical protein [Phormidesmis sp. CAN_BIN44]
MTIGCDDVLYKPFREEQLFRTIERHLQVRYLYDDANQIAETADAFAQTIEPAFNDLLAVMPLTGLPIFIEPPLALTSIAVSF